MSNADNSSSSTTADVNWREEGAVLVVEIANPSVNALSTPVRQGLIEGMQAARADGVEAVVLIGADRTFSAGADMAEVGSAPVPPFLPEVVDAIESCPKPVVAAIRGAALGGGLEIALGCHYRVAVPSARLGLPEVKLGFLPGAGGTQRLPRLIGVEAARPAIAFGEPMPASRAEALGLLDRIVGEDSFEAHAIAFAREVAKRGEPPASSRRTQWIERVDASVFDRFRQENARRLKGLDAPEACIQAVQAAVEMPFEEGVKLERDLSLQLRRGPQSRALRHAFSAERAAARVEGLPPDLRTIPIGKVGLVGAGLMGGGIAMNFLSAGMPVVMVEREQEALDRGVVAVRKNYEASAKKSRLTTEAVEAAMVRLSPTLSFDALSDCDLVIEAVFETMAVKTDVLRRVDEAVKPGAILASNTSYLDLDEIAAATRRPESVIGLHFFSPANVMRLLEVVRGARTSPQVVATCMALAKRIGKVAVLAGVCHGFIGNRMLAVRRREADRLILQGAPYDRVDQVLLDFGFPMNPFQISDLAGLDLGWTRETSRGATIREVLCGHDRRGQKNGGGFYDYDEARNRTPSPEVRGIIAEFARKSGEPQREISEQEILERLLYPMVNEGALILAEKIAQRASDIDVVWLLGYGWPAWTGGPMFWAGETGLDRVAEALQRHRPNLDLELRLSPTLLVHAANRTSFS